MAIAAGAELTEGSEELLRDLLETLVEFAPEDFLDGPFGPRDTCGANAAQGAHLIGAHNFDFRITLGEFLADDGIIAGWAAVARDVTRASSMRRSKLRQYMIWNPAPKVPRSCMSVPIATSQPSLTLPTTFSTGTRTSRKKSSENSDSPVIWRSGRTSTPGGSHVDQQHGEAFMFRRGGVGAHDEFAPVGSPAVAVPHLLAVDDVVIAVDAALRCCRLGEIGCRR